jgi:hypothetical protein
MSWKHDFPMEWQRYVDGDATLSILTIERIPYSLRSSFVGTETPVRYFKLVGEDLTELETWIESYSPATPFDDVWLLYQWNIVYH